MEFFKRLFHGRLNRRSYTVGMLIVVSVLILYIYFLHYLIHMFYPFTITGKNILFLFLLFLRFVLWPFLFLLVCSFNARRLHDLGYTGWLSLFYFIPVLNLIGFLLLLKGGEKKENKYGKSPEPKIAIKGLLSIG